MTLADVEARCKIAVEAGAQIERWDFDYGAGCRYPGAKTALVISEVYRRERDGYTGAKIISEDMLRDWLAKNKP